MQVASHEENQQLVALAAVVAAAAAVVAAAAAATIFSHFWIYYKLNMVSLYIWVDSRLKGFSIESKNTQKGLRTKKLWPSEV